MGATAAMLRGQRARTPAASNPGEPAVPAAPSAKRGPSTPAADETLERLLAAKQRARKRARGEEE